MNLSLLGPALTDVAQSEPNLTWQQWLNSSACLLLETTCDDDGDAIALWYRWQYGSRCNFVVYAGHVLVKFCDWHARQLMDTLADRDEREKWLNVCERVDEIARANEQIWQRMSDTFEQMVKAKPKPIEQLSLFG